MDLRTQSWSALSVFVGACLARFGWELGGWILRHF